MNPNRLANLRPFPPGGPPASTRRSRHVEATIKLARKHCPEALLFAVAVLRDPGERTRDRLTAMEAILALGMPKDPATLERMLAEMTGGGVTEFRITFVDPVKEAPLVVEHAPQPGGNGHDPEPLEPVFVDPSPRGAE